MIKFEKQWFGGYHLTLFNKINFYAGFRSFKMPEIGIGIDMYERAITIHLIWLYFGVEVWHSA